MRLEIFGPTGGTGRRLVERAIAEGHEVTAFVRNPSRMSARHRRLRVVVGDASDAGKVPCGYHGNGGDQRPRLPATRTFGSTSQTGDPHLGLSFGRLRQHHRGQ